MTIGKKFQQHLDLPITYLYEYLKKFNHIYLIIPHDRFKNCLKLEGSLISNVVGYLFFEVRQKQILTIDQRPKSLKIKKNLLDDLGCEHAVL